VKRGRSTGTPTPAQLARFRAIREIGCVPCLQRGYWTACEVHHLTVGGRHGQKRRGHDYTIGLCTWHHRGKVPQPTLAALLYGPSYAEQARAFRAEFGQDDVLLARQNELIAEHERIGSIRRVV
jgi:hypothetical protein